jgi:hypothetical protein
MLLNATTKFLLHGSVSVEQHSQSSVSKRHAHAGNKCNTQEDEHLVACDMLQDVLVRILLASDLGSSPRTRPYENSRTVLDGGSRIGTTQGAVLMVTSNAGAPGSG